MSSKIPQEKKILLNKYELGQLLGVGSYAKVYHAREIRTGQSVAVKAVNKAKLETSHFTREVFVLRMMRHPHIIRIIEVLATKSKVYFIMELAKGGELFTKVARGRFSEDLSRRYFQQLVSAVQYCHSRGVYHRDLKPGNILLDDNWNLKISDFGLCAVKEQGENGMLRTVCGTPAYMAPEVLAKKGYFGEKVDIWSCGIILFVLTAGFLPFNDMELACLYKKIDKGVFRCPKWMSRELRRLLRRLLDVNPARRITIDGIMNDPWFKKDYKEIDLRFYDDDWMKKEINGSNGLNNERYLNAFDLISFSRGFNLSGLFLRRKIDEINWEVFLSTEKAETVVEMIEEAAREVDVAGVIVERVKGEFGVRMEGRNGDFGLIVVVHRLNEVFVVVEVRWRDNDVGVSSDYWQGMLKPKICHLIYRPSQIQVRSNLILVNNSHLLQSTNESKQAGVGPNFTLTNHSHSLKEKESGQVGVQPNSKPASISQLSTRLSPIKTYPLPSSSSPLPRSPMTRSCHTGIILNLTPIKSCQLSAGKGLSPNFTDTSRSHLSIGLG